MPPLLILLILMAVALYVVSHFGANVPIKILVAVGIIVLWGVTGQSFWIK